MGRRHRNSLRIIAGHWRGRRIRFPDAPGLRPTADRSRETLFNWLSADLPGARCLDLFAGSGALGFEAASRGAARVVLVDASREVAAQLAATRDDLGATDVEVVHASMARYLERTPEPFDIAFLDPPFAETQRLLAESCRRLDEGWLKPGARVYLELAARTQPPAMPGGWSLQRDLRAGDACALLYGVGG